MKGIILAGGKGTRLHPITKAISKQLLPVYNKPMIYYPISTLKKIGIKEILIITTPKDQIFFKNLLKDGSEFNVKFSYKTQKKPKGIADAFLIGEEFIGDDNVCLILGDNLFFNTDVLYENNLKKRCKIFIKKVKNPNNYGVLEEKKGVVYKIHEKPKRFISNYVVVGIYMFTNSVVEYVKRLKPSKRGEIEITDLNNIYIDNNSCEVVLLENDSIWFDSGTFDSLVDACNFVRKNSL